MIEGQTIPVDAIVRFGKKYDSLMSPDGWYVVISLPFFTREIEDFVDPNTYISKPTVCFPRFHARYRKVKPTKSYTVTKSYVWCPITIIQ